jgi:hypothetical protein
LIYPFPPFPFFRIRRKTMLSSLRSLQYGTVYSIFLSTILKTLIVISYRVNALSLWIAGRLVSIQINRFRQAGNRFLGSLKGLRIRALLPARPGQSRTVRFCRNHFNFYTQFPQQKIQGSNRNIEIFCLYKFTNTSVLTLNLKSKGSSTAKEP